MESRDGLRPLTDRERAIIDGFLRAGLPGVEELRAQLPAVKARSSCSCGCGSVALIADGGFPASSGATRPLLEAKVTDESGLPIGGLLLFTNDGYLLDLEIYSFLDEPLQLPLVERIRWESANE